MTDFLYDFSVGVACALIGALISMVLSQRKTRRLTREITQRRQNLESLRLENNQLLAAIKNRETQILELQQKILDNHKKSVCKKTRRK